MGWGRGGDVFDPVAKTLIKFVEEKRVSEDEAITMLTLVARSLLESDWDTVDESIYAADSHPIVMEALRLAGW